MDPVHACVYSMCGGACTSRASAGCMPLSLLVGRQGTWAWDGRTSASLSQVGCTTGVAPCRGVSRVERYVRSDAPAPIGYYYEPGQSVAGRSVCIDGRRVGVSGFAIIASRGDGPVGSVALYASGTSLVVHRAPSQPTHSQFRSSCGFLSGVLARGLFRPLPHGRGGCPLPPAGPSP